MSRFCGSKGPTRNGCGQRKTKFWEMAFAKGVQKAQCTGKCLIISVYNMYCSQANELLIKNEGWMDVRQVLKDFLWIKMKSCPRHDVQCKIGEKQCGKIIT